MHWVKGFPKITSELELEPWFQVLFCSQGLFPMSALFTREIQKKKKKNSLVQLSQDLRKYRIRKHLNQKLLWDHLGIQSYYCTIVEAKEQSFSLLPKATSICGRAGTGFRFPFSRLSSTFHHALYVVCLKKNKNWQKSWSLYNVIHFLSPTGPCFVKTKKVVAMRSGPNMISPSTPSSIVQPHRKASRYSPEVAQYEWKVLWGVVSHISGGNPSK